MMSIEPEVTPAVIAVLQERQTRQDALQLQVIGKLDLILAKFELLPELYLPRREWVGFQTEFARAALATEKRIDMLDSRADALRMWLIGTLSGTVLSLALLALPHITGK